MWRYESALAGLSGAGAMASVLLGARNCARGCMPWGTALVIAAINGPTRCRQRGRPTAMELFGAACERDGTRSGPWR